MAPLVVNPIEKRKFDGDEMNGLFGEQPAQFIYDYLARMSSNMQR
jgi:hypothetical protein